LKNAIVHAAPLVARVIAVIDLRREDRGLRLATWTSRAIRSGEIHELIATDEPAVAASGTPIDAVSYLAFVEFTQGGVVLIGSILRRKNVEIGRLRGFDETHMPNHMNIIVQSPHRATGAELGWQIGDRIDFVPPAQACA
jgi:hypothetical protein